MRGPRIAAGLCAVVLALVAIAPAVAQERYARDWSDHPGMPRQVWDVTPDERGFLWIASEEGIHRFDGSEVVPWFEAAQSFVQINRGPRGRLVTFTEQGKIYEKTAAGFEPLLRDGEVAFLPVHDADYGSDGSLWVCATTGLFRRSPQGDWSQIDTSDLSDRTPLKVRPAPDHGAFVGTDRGDFIRVFADGTTETWWSDPSGRVTRIAVKDAHTQAFGLRFGPNHGLYLVEAGKVRVVYRNSEVGRRWTGMVFRGDTLWAVHTSKILVVRDGGERIEMLDSRQGFHPGGTVVVDPENSLWITSFRGLFQFPEPDVVLWTEMDGTRQVHRVGDDIVVGRWRGPYRQSPSGGWNPMTPEGYAIFDWGGISPWDTSWFVAVQYPDTPRRRSALLEIGPDGWTHHRTGDYGVFDGSYATDEAGTFWIAFHNHLWRVDGPGEAPRQVAQLTMDKAIVHGLQVEGPQVSLIFRKGPYCEATLNADRDALIGDWTCEVIEGARELLAHARVDGVPWVGTWDRGVVRRVGNRWEDVVGSEVLGTNTIRGITLSPSGGVWVVTYQNRVRVRLDEDGIEVLERLGPWMGVPNWMLFNVFEEPSGSLWISGMTSAIEVPAEARQRPTTAPRVYVTGFRVDGRELESEDEQLLPATSRRIDLNWAAPAYRDPASMRYQVRLDSQDEWIPTRERSFRFVGLAPGDYRVEVRASLDGETWSESPADFRFSIRSPVWQRPGFWAAMLGAAAIAVLTLQWLRARQQVRLERQRTEIAMNLHDELGAGLGSIGLLTDLASDESMEPSEGREVVARVGEISRDLSRSLSDIVWTLRPASAELSGFALFLRQRAADLLSAAETAVEFRFPDPVPPIRLALQVRREIHAIASEALHNAAKHARASKIRVQLEARDPAWVLRIKDDGVGFDAAAKATGMGLDNMRKRAGRIRADFSVRSSPGGGCVVELVFHPRLERVR